jgi:hypothetical protein
VQKLFDVAAAATPQPSAQAMRRERGSGFAQWRSHCTKLATDKEYRSEERLRKGKPCDFCGFEFFEMERKLKKTRWCCEHGLAMSTAYQDFIALPTEIAKIFMYVIDIIAFVCRCYIDQFSLCLLLVCVCVN